MLYFYVAFYCEFYSQFYQLKDEILKHELPLKVLASLSLVAARIQRQLVLTNCLSRDCNYTVAIVKLW